jgi:hypothetical protein
MKQHKAVNLSKNRQYAFYACKKEHIMQDTRELHVGIERCDRV